MNAAQAELATREELIAENNRLEAELAEVKYRLGWLERQLFGTKSERFVADDTQTRLELGVEPHTAPVRTQAITYERHTEKKNDGHSRGPMPTHLPVKDIIIELAEDVSGCERIGEEMSWRYEMKRGSLYIERTIRPKYVRRDGAGIAVAGLPAQVIEKGNAGPGLMTQVITDKYVYGIPLDRQRRKYRAEYGVEFSESLMCDWTRLSCFWLEPVYDVGVEAVRKSAYIQADETPIQVLVHDVKGRTHRGYFWVYRAVEEGIVVFVYSPSRGRAGPSEFLKDFKGILQVDGYAGYNEVLSRGDITRAACMAHVRRGFEKALPYFAGEATYALKTMGEWFVIERESKKAGLDPAARLGIRRERIAPSMQAFYEWLVEKARMVLPKSPLGKAVSYALNQWKGFEPFLKDGRVELSNNGVENDIRPVAVGRKNYLFKGSHDAAQRGAMIYSIVETARLMSLDPYRVVYMLLTKLPGAKASDIETFAPCNWPALIAGELEQNNPQT